MRSVVTQATASYLGLVEKGLPGDPEPDEAPDDNSDEQQTPRNVPKTLDRNEGGVNLGSKGIGQRKNDWHVDGDGNQRNSHIDKRRHPVGTNNNMRGKSQAGQEAGQKKRPVPILVKPGLESLDPFAAMEKGKR